MRSFLTCFLFLGLAPSLTLADPIPSSEDEAKVLFEKGNSAFLEGRYVDALAVYRQAYRLAPKPVVLYNLARCEELLGDYEAAYADFERFLAMGVGTDQLALVQTKLFELKDKVQVTVRVTSEPTGALVFLDGEERPLGRTPAEGRVALGPHRVLLRLDGFPPREAFLDGQAGKQNAVHVVLRAETPTEEPRSQGTLLVRTSTPNALVFIDGMPIGPTPLSRTLAPGRYPITVEKVGYASWQDEVDIAEGDSLIVDVALSSAGSQVRPGSRRIATWTLGSVGGAAMLGGGVLGFLAFLAHGDFEEEPQKSKAERMESLALASDVLVGVGTLALLASYWVHSSWTPERSTAKTERMSAAPSPSPSYGRAIQASPAASSRLVKPGAKLATERISGWPW